MDFINKVGETITNKGKDVAQKAKDIAEMTSLYGQMSSQKGNLNRIYQELGKLYYEQHKEQSNDIISEKCNQISATYTEIERLGNVIMALKRKKKCQECGLEVSEEAAFCSACGAKILTEAPVSEEVSEQMGAQGQEEGSDDEK
jgi:hypothetical protein